MSTDARTAVGSVFGAVNETALTVTTAVMTVSSSVAMLNAFINKERVKQGDRDVIEMSDYRDRLIEDAAKSTADRRVAHVKWIEQDARRAPIYEEAYNKYQNLFVKAEG